MSTVTPKLNGLPAVGATSSTAAKLGNRSSAHIEHKPGAFGKLWLRKKQHEQLCDGQSTKKPPGQGKVCTNIRESYAHAEKSTADPGVEATRSVCHESFEGVASCRGGSAKDAPRPPAAQIPEGTPSSRWPKQPTDRGLFEL